MTKGFVWHLFASMSVGRHNFVSWRKNASNFPLRPKHVCVCHKDSLAWIFNFAIRMWRFTSPANRMWKNGLSGKQDVYIVKLKSSLLGTALLINAHGINNHINPFPHSSIMLSSLDVLLTIINFPIPNAIFPTPPFSPTERQWNGTRVKSHIMQWSRHSPVTSGGCSALTWVCTDRAGRDRILSLLDQRTADRRHAPGGSLSAITSPWTNIPGQLAAQVGDSRRLIDISQSARLR